MLGTLLAELRAARGLSMVQVIETLGVPRSTAYFWESPASRPEPEHLQALLTLYGASDAQQLQAWKLRSAGRDAVAPLDAP
jgi:transcriptional regulator with XRE-family HTH domain